MLCLHNFTGDIAELNVLRTWEFTNSKPIRSIIFPYTIGAVPAIVVCLLEWLQYEINDYLLLILPRLLMCMLSFLQDLFLYNICNMMGTKCESCLLLFASSYVTLTYFTRTFSNSLESFLFSFLLFLCFKSIKLQKKLTGEETCTAFSRLSFYSFMCGITLSLGCFIRPTFVCFSVFPILHCFFIFLKLKAYNKTFFLSFALGVISMSICAVAIDSFYYSKMHYSFINDVRVVYTPINFLLYNLSPANLGNHGLHPRYLHVLLNIPLLFSVYGTIILLHFIKICCCAPRRLKINFEIMLLLTFISPLILLSIIPHQEPRFIIPLIVPFSLLYSTQNLRSFLSYKSLTFVWVCSNLFCFLFYGFIHQAGVYSSINYLSNVIGSNSCVIYYKTYMPPRYLFHITEKHNNVNVHDLAGLELDKFEYEIQNIVGKKVLKVFMVLPYKVYDTDITFEALTMLGFKFVERIHIFPHLSTEILPKIIYSIHNIVQKNSSFMSKLYDLQELLSIHIIEFQRDVFV